MKSLFALLATSVVAQQSVLDNFQCLPDPEVIKYNNSDATPTLPVVRIMMCGYSSQCALNMVAYVFMKEKLGMNVTFYPTLDYDDVWSGAYWDGWNGSMAYPRNYFEWLFQDDMDLNFEFWPTQLVRTSYSGEITFDGKTEYVLSGKIDFGGFVGAYGEESIWIPAYYVENHPKSIIPQQVRDDATYREALVNGSKNGPTNYYQLYNGSTAFDRTNDTNKPIVWGSSPSYFMSQYANDLKNNAVDGGMNVSFVTTGGEGSLATLVSDLYSQRVPFLANIYTIDDNFGIVGNVTSGELQQFEKIAFARNPDQSLYDPCFTSKQCQYPIGPIMKAANPLLESRFPEAHEYFTNFQIGTRQLNQIVSNYWNVNDSTMGNTEKWLTAACEWLKSNDSSAQETWNNDAWLINVVRFDCLSGCGIQATSGSLSGQEIGGSCNYYTGTCVCDYDELFPDLNCQESCPGLLGPFVNSTDNEYYFSWCSGHGSCDTITRQCTCDKGYGGDGCQTAYTQFKLAVGLQVVIVLFSVILAIVCIGCIVWLRMNKHYKTVKALSVDMTTIMTVGLLMIVCSNIPSVVVKNSISCIAWQWLFGLGGILSIMSPLLKAYRVSRVFHGGKMLRAVKITDKMLMSMLIKFAIIEVLVCVGYSVLHELFGGASIYYNHDELRTEDKCNDNSLTQYVSMASYAYFFIMLCALTKFSYGTRRALAVFKESTCAYFSSFLSLLCTLIVMVFFMATQDPTFRTAIQSFAIILVVAAVLALFYGTRIYTFFTEPENRNVTDMNAIRTSTTSKSGFSNPVMKEPIKKPEEEKQDNVVAAQSGEE